MASTIPARYQYDPMTHTFIDIITHQRIPYDYFYPDPIKKIENVGDIPIFELPKHK